MQEEDGYGIQSQGSGTICNTNLGVLLKAYANFCAAMQPFNVWICIPPYTSKGREEEESDGLRNVRSI